MFLNQGLFVGLFVQLSYSKNVNWCSSSVVMLRAAVFCPSDMPGIDRLPTNVTFLTSLVAGGWLRAHKQSRPQKAQLHCPVKSGVGESLWAHGGDHKKHHNAL